MWKNEKCKDEDFVMELTDFGVCYTFNSISNETKSTDVTGKVVIRNTSVQSNLQYVRLRNLSSD